MSKVSAGRRITSEELVTATSVIEQNGFTTYDSVFHGEADKSRELETRSAAHPLEPWTSIGNMVHVIQPNPITHDYKAGLQLGAPVPGQPDGENHYTFMLSIPVYAS